VTDQKDIKSVLYLLSARSDFASVEARNLITRLRAELAEALKYAAPENAKALPHIKNPCKVHNEYWTTHFGACMACRANKAEAELAAWKAESEAAKAPIDEALVFDRSDERQIEKHAREDAAWYRWQVARANTDRIAKEKA